MNRRRIRSCRAGRWLRALRATCALVLACAAAVPAAHAETRAWLDRSGTARDEAVTLNIETDQHGVAPDYAPLRADFTLGPPYRSSRATRDGRTLFGVALTPRRSGTLPVPALQVGAERTPALALVVSPAPATQPGGDVFIESRVDDPRPYVQQSVGLTLRLHYATPLLSGELVQDPPSGVSLQRAGEDLQSSREIGGRRYQVVERRYLLVPERSGPLVLPPARFQGKGAGGFFDDFFGSDRNLSARGAPVVLDVRAQPAGAPQPWLPLRGLRLRYVAAPAQARVGEAVEVVVEAVAQGATAAQFPDIPAPRVDGAQVFAERAETTERFVDGGPQLTVVRRFSVVPLQAGTLRVPGVRMDWWDASAGRARVAALPDLAPVATGTAGVAAPPVGAVPAAPAVASPPDARPAAMPSARAWRWLAAGFAALWLGTLVLLFVSRRQRGESAAVAAAPSPRSRPVLADLRRSLDAGSLGEVGLILQRMSDPPAADLDEVIARLDDSRQRAALEAMRRTVWAGGGEAAPARAALRAAFRDGPRWADARHAADAPLPPLYPPR